MYVLSKSFVFSAAHYLDNYKGECSNLHGHNWKIIVNIQGAFLNELGILIDFKEIKAIIKERIGARLDHKYLNQCLPFNPTAENLAEWIFGQITDELRKDDEYMSRGIEVESIVVYEGEDSCCKFVL